MLTEKPSRSSILSHGPQGTILLQRRPLRHGESLTIVRTPHLDRAVDVLLELAVQRKVVLGQELSADLIRRTLAPHCQGGDIATGLSKAEFSAVIMAANTLLREERRPEQVLPVHWLELTQAFNGGHLGDKRDRGFFGGPTEVPVWTSEPEAHICVFRWEEQQHAFGLAAHQESPSPAVPRGITVWLKRMLLSRVGEGLLPNLPIKAHLLGR